MKTTALAIVAAIAVANVAAADQPALRAAVSPVETATTAEKSIDGTNKKEFWGWGGPWGGYGWGGRWGGGWGGCCGLGGWGGWGW